MSMSKTNASLYYGGLLHALSILLFCNPIQYYLCKIIINQYIEMFYNFYLRYTGKRFGVKACKPEIKIYFKIKSRMK